jgi:hypothetical protein
MKKISGAHLCGLGPGAGSALGSGSGADKGTKIGQTKGKGAGTSATIYDPPRDPAPKRKNTNDGFPPHYNSIRAARANTSTITPLGGIGGVGRAQVRQGIGAATGGFEVEGDHQAVQCAKLSRFE